MNKLSHMKRVCLIAATVASLLAESSRGADAKPPALPEKLRPQAEAAQKAFAAGDYREAVSVYGAMRKTAPDNAWVLSNLAVAQLRMGQFKQAEETLRAALALAPDDGFCRRMLGIVSYSQQKYDDAITELTKALAIDPKDAEAHLYLAFCSAQKGLTEVASKEFDLAAKFNPDYKAEATKAPDADRHWPPGDYLTPLERSRLRLPPMPLVR
jgi:tetratricopeptide (TPR) repeat protein